MGEAKYFFDAGAEGIAIAISSHNKGKQRRYFYFNTMRERGKVSYERKKRAK